MLSEGRDMVLSAGAAQRALAGGHQWALLHFLLAARRLGWRTLFVDRRIVSEGESSTENESGGERLAAIMSAYEVAYAILDEDGRSQGGISREDVLEVVRRAPIVFNVFGFLRDAELLEAASRKVFLDIDPGWGQMWRELGLADLMAGHDAFVTIGENIGREYCDVPVCGRDWITTPPPVVLDEWPVAPGGRAFTTVATWRGPYGTVDYKGRTYGSRVHEFRKFAELPGLVDAEFELALDIHPAEVDDLRLLDENGWRLVDPIEVAGDPWTYRSYVQQSRAELCVAQNMYVDTHCGWVSDRSICYLASGKPVLAQDTGFTRNYPTGEGLLAFSTLDEAAAGVEEIEGSYARHSKAARELAEEYFDSDKVLGRLLERLGVA